MNDEFKTEFFKRPVECQITFLLSPNMMKAITGVFDSIKREITNNKNVPCQFPKLNVLNTSF